MLADRIEITDLMTRFALLLDERRWDDAATVFTDDVSVHSPRGGTLHGVDRVMEFMRESDVEDQQVQHITTDVLVDVDGDQATVAANSIVHYYREGEAPHFTGSVRLSTTVVRTPAGWRIRTHHITRAWTRET